MDCPAKAIDLTIVDKAKKRFVFRYDFDRCVFCGQCLYSCKNEALAFSHADWELAGLSRAEFTKYFGDPSDVGNVLAGCACGNAHAPQHP